MIAIPIILAIAAPKLTNTRRYAQEMAAVKAIETIHTAQTQYFSQYGAYATSLMHLGPPANGAPDLTQAGLIDEGLANGEKGG
jgi:type II secretory pathway pseudopilin PulG